MKGSTPWLCALAASVLLAFWAVRAGSGFLRVEREIDQARAAARRHGLGIEDVCALRLVRGSTMPADQLDEACREFARQAQEFGTALAAIAFCGHEPAVRQALVQAGGNREDAVRILLRGREGAYATRFGQLRARFADRAATRTRN